MTKLAVLLATSASLFFSGSALAYEQCQGSGSAYLACLDRNSRERQGGGGFKDSDELARRLKQETDERMRRERGTITFPGEGGASSGRSGTTDAK